MRFSLSKWNRVASNLLLFLMTPYQPYDFDKHVPIIYREDID